MLNVVETQARDGEWYRRAYQADGKPVDSKACAEGKIFIDSQGWCVLGGARLRLDEILRTTTGDALPDPSSPANPF